MSIGLKCAGEALPRKDDPPKLAGNPKPVCWDGAIRCAGLSRKWSAIMVGGKYMRKLPDPWQFRFKRYSWIFCF